MTTDTIAIQKEQSWHREASGKRPAISPLTLACWRIAQYAVLFLGMALLPTLLYFPAIGLNIMWNGLIPIAPALLVIAPGLWRNICPMSTFSLLPHRFGFSGRRMLPRRWAGLLALIALVALFVIVPLRHLSLDTNAPLTALMLAISALLAIALGMAFEWRSGWCNSLCPIHPVEKLYGQSPAITLPNMRCDECRSCSAPCPDSTRSMNPTLTGSSFIEKAAGHFIVGALSGFIWGWYRLPDYHGALSANEIVAAFTWPYGGALITLAIYAAAYRWACRSDTNRRLLVKLFATAAVCMYYWYRIPALAGFGPNPGTGMLLDLSDSLPDLPLLTRTVSTSFFVWFVLLRKETGASWATRPVFKPIIADSTHD
jgi:hypothetical protein